MNRKVWIVNEIEDVCIGTVGQVLRGKWIHHNLQDLICEAVERMQADECYDDESINFTIELR